MEEKTTNDSRHGNRIFLMAGSVMLLLGVLIRMTAQYVPGFADWYGEYIYSVLAGTIGRVGGFFPFSVAEAGLYILIIFCLFYSVKFRRKPGKLLSRGVFLTEVLFFSYIVCCGVNYYRTPFSEYAGIERRESSKEELEELCRYLTEKVNGYEVYAGKSLTLKEYNEAGTEAMEKLGKEYPVLRGFYPRPKALGISWILSVQQLAGIYAPFTIEANYNRDMVPYNIPHTLCHELSHLKGFMREDEANFIGYLACIEAEKEEFRYSGYLMGWIYATNALAREDRDTYTEIYLMLDEKIRQDLRINSLFWNKYEGKVAQAADKVNDTYLKINNQEDGVKSYGRVVDLMLAHYRKMEKKS